MGQGLSALVQDIAPTDAGSLYKAVSSSEVMERTLHLVKEDNLTDIVDETLLSATAHLMTLGRHADKFFP